MASEFFTEAMQQVAGALELLQEGGIGIDFEEKISMLKKFATSDDKGVTNRGKARVQRLLLDYEPPQHDKASWRQANADIAMRFKRRENKKQKMRELYKSMVGYAGQYPEEYDKDEVPDNKDTVTKDPSTKTVIGTSPFVEGNERILPRTLLQYEDTLEWKDWKHNCKVEITNFSPSSPDKRYLILSLTVEEIMIEAQKRGCSYKQLGIIMFDFMFSEKKDSLSKVSDVSKETKKIFHAVEDIINLREEMRTAEKSLGHVCRGPWPEPLNKALDNYHAKLMILHRLRDIDSESNKSIEKIREECNELAWSVAMDLIDKEIRDKISKVKIAKYSALGRDFSLQDLCNEVQTFEEEHPDWRLKAPVYCRSTGTFMKPKGPGENAITALAQLRRCDEGEFYGSDEGETSELEEEESPEDPVPDTEEEDTEESSPEDNPTDEDLVQDDNGEVFLISNRRKPKLFEKKTKPKKKEKTRKPGSGKTNVITRKETPRSDNRRGGFQKSPKNTSQSKGRSDFQQKSNYCLRCGSPTHNHRECPRYGEFFRDKCSLCFRKEGKTLFHDPKKCRYASSGYKTPSLRSGSENREYGFRSPARTPSPFDQRAKNASQP